MVRSILFCIHTLTASDGFIYTQKNYDVRHNNGRSLEVSIYELTDRPEKLYVITPLEYNLKPEELKLIERVRKKMIRHRPHDLNFADPSNSREYFRRMGKQMLVDDARVHNIALTPFQINTYSDLLAKYTTGLGILEDLLSDERVTDVYINAPADLNPVHVVMDGDECATNIFLSQDDLDSMVSRTNLKFERSTCLLNNSICGVSLGLIL